MRLLQISGIWIAILYLGCVSADDKPKATTNVVFRSKIVLRTNDERIVRIVTKAIRHELWERDTAELRSERIDESDKDVDSLILEMERVGQ